MIIISLIEKRKNMFKIINIECKNDSFIENGSIERENTFYGQAVIDKDGYFEGLVTVPYSGIYIKRLIFGVFNDENVSLYKFEPTNEGIRTRYDSYAFDDELPGSFCVSSNDDILAVLRAVGDLSEDTAADFRRIDTTYIEGASI